MEFWGVEVKAGKPFKVTPDEDNLIHISQASLGESKDKKGESVPLFVKVDDKKLVMGTLSQENFPQISLDLVFEREFELSHNWKHGSIYFIGYKSPNVDGQDEEDFYSDEESDEEEVPATITENGKPGGAVENVKAIATKAEVKPKAKAAEGKKIEPESEDDDSDEDDSSDSQEEGMDVDEDDDSEDEDDDSEDEEEETPKKVEPSKKRANESAAKTPVSAKKAKAAAATPQKTEEKKGGHSATPHPAKKGGKTPANASQSPKSGAQISCGSCKKSFNSDTALQSHNKAKHAAK